MSTDKRDTRQWFLRTADNTIFGPVATPAFVLWAEQGRIMRGNTVSTDRQNWLAAETVPELEITWYISDSAGNLRGPFNRVVAETMLKSDKLPPGAQLVPAAEADPARIISQPNEPRPTAANDVVTVPQPDNAEATAALKAAQQRVKELETELARQKETLSVARQAGREAEALEKERDALALALDAAQQQHATELAATTEKLEKALATATEKLEGALAVATEQLESALAAQKEATERADTLHQRVELIEQELGAVKDQLQTATVSLDESRGAYSELLTYSNSREEELQAKIAELAKPLTPVERAAEACAADPGGILSSIMSQEATLLEGDLAQERKAINQLREISNQRQAVIQDRIHELRRIAHGGIEGGGATRFRALDATRLQAEIDTLRATQSQTMRAAEERATELSNKVRTLENETLRLRSQATETDKLTRANREQADTIRRREQELEQERKQHELERENFTTTQQALLRRIEQLERGIEDKELKLDYAGSKQNDREAAAPSRRSNLGPWFSLKK